MANIVYSQINNTCFNDALGSIFIEQINFTTPSEQASFSSYNIQWSGDFESLSQISADSRITEFLRNGNYSFSIISNINSSILGPYNITITSPPELLITDVKYNKYSCSSDGGRVRVYVTGGVPPYNVYVGGVSVTTSESDILLSGIIPGSSEVTVIDTNNCSYTFDKEVIILDSIIEATFAEILAPTLYNSYGTIKVNITGYGPFNMWFTNLTTNEVIFIDGLSTEYIDSVINDNEYNYKIDDKLVPGEYTVNIKNNFGCSLETSVSVPNIAPMSVNCFITNDDREIFINKQLSLPIFDTILIPYKHIQQDSDLWKLIKNYSLKDVINISIDNNKKQYKIVRNMLDKYCLDENKVEILRLSNSSDDWYYYLYIAPAINLSANFNLVNSQYSIIDPSSNESYPLIFGLTTDGVLDKENPSIIRGSFLLNGIDHNQFVNTTSYVNFTDKKNNAYISFDDSRSEDHDFFIHNISKKILKNIYVADYVTAINFLEQFNRLNIYVNINDTACNSSIEDYRYMLQTKELIESINNLNNVTNTYIYNIDNISKIGQINISIGGPNSFILENNVSDTNSYDISYFTFDDESTNLSTFYRNNEPIKTTQLRNIGEGYIILRIKDKYNNIPRSITFNSTTFDYDNHFVAAKNIIQKFNRNITSLFNYGDILCYVGSKNNSNPLIDDTSLPKPDVQPPPQPPVVSSPVIEQTHDSSNTSSLVVNLYKNIMCTLYGPKNYQHLFNTDITFTNMIPGVYRIAGNEKELFNNNLYSQEFRIVIDRNTTNNIDIDFVSYQDKVFIKEIS